MTDRCKLVKTFLVLCLGCFAECLRHNLSLAEIEATRSAPLSSHLLEALIAHVAYAKHPNVFILVDGVADLGNESRFGSLGCPDRRLS